MPDEPRGDQPDEFPDEIAELRHKVEVHRVRSGWWWTTSALFGAASLGALAVSAQLHTRLDAWFAFLFFIMCFVALRTGYVHMFLMEEKVKRLTILERREELALRARRASITPAAARLRRARRSMTYGLRRT